MIEAKGLVRRYDDFLAVDNVSFTIEPGQVVGLLGHNGAGKTTIMKMITGFLEPSSGSITVNGTDVQDDPLTVQSQLGYLPENLPLYPEMTVAQYLSFTAQLRNLDPATCVAEAIGATQLEAKALDPIETLSRGYKQRVGVAQAILHKPKYLILDEPSNGLDPNQIQHMRDLIRELAEHATVILSTHIMQEVSAVCDRTLMMRTGQLVIDENLDQLQRTDELKLLTQDDTKIAEINFGSGVQQVVNNKPGEWRFTVAQDHDLNQVCAQIAQNLVQAGVQIHELRQQRKDLEQVFSEINQVEPSAAGGQHAA